jgi:hypothetical protein
MERDWNIAHAVLPACIVIVHVLLFTSAKVCALYSKRITICIICLDILQFWNFHTEYVQVLHLNVTTNSDSFHKCLSTAFAVDFRRVSWR